MSEEDLGNQWLLYGRRAIDQITLRPPPPSVGAKRQNLQRKAEVPRVKDFTDNLPSISGRVLSLATSVPYWLLKHQPNLLWAPAHRLPIWLPRRTARVVTVHDLCWIESPASMRPVTRWLDRAMMPRSLETADRIIAVSEATRTRIVNFNPTLADRIVVVHEAAEKLPSPQGLGALAPIDISVPYLLFVGNAEPRKNLTRLIKAFAALEESLRQRFQIVVAGGRGWGGVDVMRTASEFGVGDRVRILGQISEELLSTLYRHARCICMPSIYEGFGLPVLEALSLGTPALVAGGSSLPEVAGDAGLVVDPRSVDSIRSGLEAMMTNDALHRTLADSAIRQASKFSWERAARETLKVFDEAVAARREKVRLGLA